jgi:hypothetical protein
VSVRVRSARPLSTASIEHAAGAGVAHGSASDRNCALASKMRLTMPDRAKVRGRAAEHPVILITNPPSRRFEECEVGVRALALAMQQCGEIGKGKG